VLIRGGIQRQRELFPMVDPVDGGVHLGVTYPDKVCGIVDRHPERY